MLKADLHTHTKLSDGVLTPDELMARALTCGVDLLSITDHDTVRAYATLRSPTALTVIPGVEFSTNWGNIGIHVVGLGIDPHSAVMRHAVVHQQRVRRERGARIAEALLRAGLPDLWADACARAGDNAPGRPHFAAAIVACGQSPDEKHAFRRFLGKGRTGNIRADWALVNTVIGWIRDAGGVAVLAHPSRYKIGARALDALVTDFTEAGGEAIEVISGCQRPEITQRLAALALGHKLLASIGSDFHGPQQTWLRLGLKEGLPKACSPIWERF